MDFEKYYALPNDKRWLDTPYEIGGRSTDVEQIGFSLYNKIKSIFPINEVPTEVKTKLDKVIKSLEMAEEEIEDLIDMVSEYIMKEE